MRRTLGLDLHNNVPTDALSTQSMIGEEILDLWHHQETSRKDPPLQCKCKSHDSFVIKELCIEIDLILPVNTPPVGMVGHWGESTIR